MSVPNLPGVYRLHHPATGYVYIGSSLCLGVRERYWRDIIESDELYSVTTVNRHIKAAFRETGPTGWFFEVLHLFPAGTSAASIWAREEPEIKAAMAAHGRRCLNRELRPPPVLTRKRKPIIYWKP